jgi:hypothetical protein
LTCVVLGREKETVKQHGRWLQVFISVVNFKSARRRRGKLSGKIDKMASSKVARRRQGSLGLPKDSPPPPTVNGAASPCQSLDNLDMLKTIG